MIILGVAEDASPFSEAEIGGEDAGALIELAEQKSKAPPEALNAGIEHSQERDRGQQKLWPTIEIPATILAPVKMPI
ncbi:hypothetical protein ACVJGD_004540 [Bradyrhizobium sp. USDA 10063]